MARSRVLDASLGYLKQNFPNSRVTAFSDQDDELRVPGINLDELDVTELLGQVRPPSDVSQPSDPPPMGALGPVLADPRRPGYGVRPMTGGPGGLSRAAQSAWDQQLSPEDQAKKPLSFMQKIGDFGDKYGGAITAGSREFMQAPGPTHDPWTAAMAAAADALTEGQEVRKEEQEAQRVRNAIKAAIGDIPPGSPDSVYYDALRNAAREAAVQGDTGLANALNNMVAEYRPETITTSSTTPYAIKAFWSVGPDGKPKQHHVRHLIRDAEGNPLLDAEGIEVSKYIRVDPTELGWTTTKPDTEDDGAGDVVNIGLAYTGRYANEGLKKDDRDHLMAGNYHDPNDPWELDAEGNQVLDSAGNPIKKWIAGEWFLPEGVDGNNFFETFLINVAGYAPTGDVGKFQQVMNMGIRALFPDNQEWTLALEGWAESYNFINPVVRYLSGAQMTDAEARRYAQALMPLPGDRPEVVKLKRLRRDIMIEAMDPNTDFGRRVAEQVGDLSENTRTEYDRQSQRPMDIYFGGLEKGLKRLEDVYALAAMEANRRQPSLGQYSNEADTRLPGTRQWGVQQ